MELHDHQKKAIEKLRNGSILWGGVGTGKSFTALGYYITSESPKDIYVITTAKKRDSLDWEREAAQMVISTHKDSTAHGLLHVDSWNNIGKYVDIRDAFFILDEQRLVGRGAWTKAFLKIAKANNWIMLSGTPGDTWLDYVPVFLANGFYRNRTEFVREHVVYNTFAKFPKVDHYVNKGKLEKYRRQILVEMPYTRHTRRHIKKVEVEYDALTLKEITKSRWNPYSEEPMKDISELFRTARKLTATDPSRLNEIRELRKIHPKLIIFYNFDYELEILRTLADDCEVAEWNGHRHQNVPEGKDEWIYLVQYTAGAEGWNCVETDTMIFYSLTYSYKLFEQSQGRIDRMNTQFTDLYYYVLRSNSWIDNAVWEALKRKETFNEKRFTSKTTL